MVDVTNKAALTRPHWGGAAADIDIHIEAYEGDIDGSFRVESLFRASGLTNFKSVANASNTWRGDRISGVTVLGRKSGEQLTDQRIASDKFIVTVDTTSFIRTPFDFQDDWTAPDFQAEYSKEHGSAHAKAFDQAHIIQLIKCAAFVPPAALASSFNPGIGITMTGYTAPTATALLTAAEVRADIIVTNHKNALATFVKRDQGGSLTEFVTLAEPDTFNYLLDHKKLMNVDFQGGMGDNNFAMRRVGYLNGLRVIETPRFPTGVITNHILGPSFNVSAAEAKAKMIIFQPSKALVTVEALGMTVQHWEYRKDFQSYLDSYCMYTVGQKRPDAVAVLFAD